MARPTDTDSWIILSLQLLTGKKHKNNSPRARGQNHKYFTLESIKMLVFYIYILCI